MRTICSRCQGQIDKRSIEVSIRMHGLVYSTAVVGRTCSECRKSRIDPNEVAAYQVGVAMRRVGSGQLTGRSYGFCRKALRLGIADHAKRLAISEECLLALEDSEALVPPAMFNAMARRVRRCFRALVFVPRFALDEEGPPSARQIDAQ